MIVILLALITVLLVGCGDVSQKELAASVSMSGGSGRAYIESPCKVISAGDETIAEIIWSSPNYDYMIVGEKTYYPVNDGGNSTFQIPIELDKDMTVAADTTAMSTPHLIEYTLRFSLISDEDFGKELYDADESTNQSDAAGYGKQLSAPNISGLELIGTDENDCAKGFAIHRYSDGYSAISVYDDRNYFLVPEGKEIPEGLDGDIKVLHMPLDSIYLAASGAMCHFDSIGAVSDIVLSGIDKDKWYIDSAKTAMEEGTLLYGGKYSAPDYEIIIDKDVDLAIENTMILHTPKVLEKLESLGIPVFIDRSNYEDDPLGRCEWIKIYGLLTGKEQEAAGVFDQQKTVINSMGDMEDLNKSVLVFSINANHMVNVKTENDYLAKMIEIAGGNYLSFDVPGVNNMSNQSQITMEAFYDCASEADVLIYNSTIETAPSSIQELIDNEKLFTDFKAVRNGNVWYTDKSMYQFADKTGSIIVEMNQIISGEQEDTSFFHKLR